MSDRACSKVRLRPREALHGRAQELCALVAGRQEAQRAQRGALMARQTRRPGEGEVLLGDLQRLVSIGRRQRQGEQGAGGGERRRDAERPVDVDRAAEVCDARLALLTRDAQAAAVLQQLRARRRDEKRIGDLEGEDHLDDIVEPGALGDDIGEGVHDVQQPHGHAALQRDVEGRAEVDFGVGEVAPARGDEAAIERAAGGRDDRSTPAPIFGDGLGDAHGVVVVVDDDEPRDGLRGGPAAHAGVRDEDAVIQCA